MSLMEFSVSRPLTDRAVRKASACGLLVAFLIVLLPSASRGAELFDQTHARFARVLAAVVKDARVDYAKLKAAPAELDAYLGAVASVPAAEFEDWRESDRLALLLNLYNAQTLRLIIDHYPLKSIRSIGFLPGAAWRELNVRFGGQTNSLEHLEHEVIRVEYLEPRIHFSLVCAAIGCPPLRSEPFVGARLNEQLDDQARQFLASREKNRFDAAKNTLYLSPIFKWYAGDFIAPAGSVANYVKPFLPEAQRTALVDPGKVKVKFTDYDWSLNAQPNK